jgi:hypothetical protein
MKEMNPFDLLEREEQAIIHQIDLLLENYATWSMDEVFANVKAVIDLIRNHIHQKENLVLSRVQSKEGVEDIAKRFYELRTEIDETIDNLVMIHVDEPGFEQLLEKLAQQFKNVVKLSQEELFPAVESMASQDEIQEINTQLTRLLAS